MATNYTTQGSQFQDVDSTHPDAGAIELAGTLGILPPAFTDRFHPDSYLTRGEASVMLNTGQNLDLLKGSVAYVNNYFSSLTITTLEGASENITLQPNTTVFRNNVPSTLANILNGDRIQVITSEEGPRFIQAHGIVTESDVLTKVSQMTNNLLTPNQIKALMGGNWRQSEDALRMTLYDQLISSGFEPIEAEMMISGDWQSLRQLSQEAFFTALLDQVGEIPSYPGGIPIPMPNGNGQNMLQQGLANLDPNLILSLAQQVLNQYQ